MGVEAARTSSSRGALSALSGPLTRACLCSAGGDLDSSVCQSADTACLWAHCKRPLKWQLRLPSECGMYLALMSCREALHPRVASFSEEAA